eukprot:TCALIF_01240-PA protein Name:"Protein of unknown function" AED:0.11 eAED:0.11 QI:72/1/0.5/1/1/1/2/183/83
MGMVTVTATVTRLKARPVSSKAPIAIAITASAKKAMSIVEDTARADMARSTAMAAPRVNTAIVITASANMVTDPPDMDIVTRI